MKLSSQEIIRALGDDVVTVFSANKDLQGLLNAAVATSDKNESSSDVYEWTEWTTDSRVKTKHGLFFALIGENFDAHDFVVQSYDNGCRGFVVSDEGFEKIKKNPEFNRLQKCQFFVAKNTEKALQKISVVSAGKLNTLKVAITGTSGKTSAKYFCHQILDGFIAHYFSPKSFNNHIGVPMTLLDLKDEHEVGLIEIGMNHPGEIEQLAKMANPDVVVVTMVGRGHLEGVGSIEKVLEEKMSIYKYGSAHLINLDDERIFKDYEKNFYQNFKNPNIKILTFSAKDKSADIYFRISESTFDSFTIDGTIVGQKGRVTVPLAGEHHVYNVAIAAGVAITAGMSANDVWSQIKTIKPVWGRSEILKSKTDVSVYFDAYNANPESMKAFLKQTQLLSDAPYFVLGEMLEMGEHAPELHYELGRLVSQTPHKLVWFIGPSSEHFRAGYNDSGRPPESKNNLMISSTYEHSLAMKYQSVLKPKDWVALKASRGIGLERFLKDFV